MEGEVSLIDIHSHIVLKLMMVQTIENSRALLEESYRQGVRTIISTSSSERDVWGPEAKIEENFKQVQELAKKKCR